MRISWLSIFCISVSAITHLPLAHANGLKCIDVISGISAYPSPAGAEQFGRLAQFASLLREKDTVALELSFQGEQARFNSALTGLKNRGANFLYEGFIKYSSNSQPLRALLGRAKEGSGHIYVRADREDLGRLRPYLELANKIATVRPIGAENNGVTRASRTLEQKIHPDFLASWRSIEKSEIDTKIFTMTSHSLKKFDDLVDYLQSETGIAFEHRYYNDAQSVGYLVLTGKPEDLKRVIERYSEIHSFQMHRD